MPRWKKIDLSEKELGMGRKKWIAQEMGTPSVMGAIGSVWSPLRNLEKRVIRGKVIVGSVLNVVF